MDDVPQIAAQPKAIPGAHGGATRHLPAAEPAFGLDVTAEVAHEACAGFLRAYPHCPALKAHLIAGLVRRITAQIRWLYREEPAGEPHRAHWLADLHAWQAARRNIRRALAAQQAEVDAVAQNAGWREAA
jgi:hypothetical protein